MGISNTTTGESGACVCTAAWGSTGCSLAHRSASSSITFTMLSEFRSRVGAVRHASHEPQSELGILRIGTGRLVRPAEKVPESLIGVVHGFECAPPLIIDFLLAHFQRMSIYPLKVLLGEKKSPHGGVHFFFIFGQVLLRLSERLRVRQVPRTSIVLPVVEVFFLHGLRCGHLVVALETFADLIVEAQQAIKFPAQRGCENGQCTFALLVIDTL